MIDIVLQFSKYDVSGVDLVCVDHVDVDVDVVTGVDVPAGDIV